MAKLFSPIRIGAIDLSHRVALGPMTRMRADMPGNVPSPLMAAYYEQRASQGGLMITEATYISPTGNGGYASPGIVTDAQVAGWRKIVDAAHAKGARILLQLWHAGRQSHVDLQPNGQAIMKGLITGINSQRPALRGQLEQVSRSISSTSVGHPGGYGPGGAAGNAPLVIKLRWEGGGATDSLMHLLRQQVRATGGSPEIFQRKVVFR